MVNFFYDDNLIQEDREWRRKERLRQVREQEQMISRNQTSRYNQKKEEMIAQAGYRFGIEWKIEHDDLLSRLTERYEKNLASLGNAHNSATQYIDNEYIIANDQVYLLILLFYRVIYGKNTKNNQNEEQNLHIKQKYYQ